MDKLNLYKREYLNEYYLVLFNNLNLLDGWLSYLNI